MKGIVFEIIGEKAVIMENSGEFLTVRAERGWKAGDVVQVWQKKRNLRKSLAALAAGFALFFIAGLGGNWFYYGETSILSLDVNPSIELILNRFDQVVGTRSLNEEGGDLLEQGKLKYKGYREALRILLSSDRMKQYIEENSYVYFTIRSKDDEKEDRILTDLLGEVSEEIRSHHGEAQVECYRVSGELVESAHHQGVTAGKYKMLLELLKEVPDVNVEDYCHKGISEIKATIEAANAVPEEKETAKDTDSSKETGGAGDEETQEEEGHHGHGHGAGSCNRGEE